MTTLTAGPVEDTDVPPEQMSIYDALADIEDEQ